MAGLASSYVKEANTTKEERQQEHKEKLASMVQDGLDKAAMSGRRK